MVYRFYGGPNDGREVDGVRLQSMQEAPVPPRRVCVPAWTGHDWHQVYYERSGDVYLYIGESGVTRTDPRA